MTDGAQPGAISADAPVEASHGPKKGGGPFRALYNWVLKLAGHKHAEPALFAVSFAESSFFPIPPDVMLMPMVLAQPQKAWRLALVCTLGSVIGGCFGYAIGYFLREWLLTFEMFQKQLQGFETQFAQWGIFVILIKGLTPVPYKLVTIASGLALFNLPVFIGASIVTRGLRFFLVAWLFKTYGPTLGPIIEKRIGVFMLGAAAIIVAGFVVAALLH